jgi:hypothetical protein
MINDDERDYAEERANLADMRREQEGEDAHERLVERVVTELRALGTAAYLDARESARRLAEEVELRLAPNLHRYELLAKQQHTALLAATTAAGIEEGVGYDLLAAAEGVTTGYRATHAHGLHERGTRHLDDAIGRVLDTVREVLAAVEDEEQGAADAADLAETERYLLRVTR